MLARHGRPKDNDIAAAADPLDESLASVGIQVLGHLYANGEIEPAIDGQRRVQVRVDVVGTAKSVSVVFDPISLDPNQILGPVLGGRPKPSPHPGPDVNDRAERIDRRENLEHLAGRP